VELSWSTFLLELVNFLILVWILKRFLYRPILGVIAKRRAGIEKSLSDAEAMRTEAEALRERYEGRLGDWEEERQRAREVLKQEIEEQSVRALAELKATLEQERERARVSEARREADSARKTEEAALANGARFASRLLAQAAGPELEARLLELVLTELSRLPAERVATLRSTWSKLPEAIVVASAFALSDSQRRKLEQALARTTGRHIPVRFEQDDKLVAGLRVTIGAWVLGANVQDELKGLAKFAYGE
jgi:F-type H+-transporting ATPase subunit b